MRAEPLLTRAASRHVDATLTKAGVSSLLLMENAGRGAAETIVGLARARGIDRALVLVGPGNNGGDALVVARHLVLAGLGVEVHAIVEPAALKGDAAVMGDAWRAVGGAVRVVQRADDSAMSAKLVVDGLFGTGLSRPLEGVAAALVASCNRVERVLSVALDIPSGLDADTGAALGDGGGVFRATHTLTFGTSKPGLHTGFGVVACGEVSVVGLGAALPDAVLQSNVRVVREARVGPRKSDTHKGDHGRVLVIGGSAGMTGAAVLASRAALRAGAGLVTIASRAMGSIDPKILEATSLELPEDPAGAVRVLEGAWSRADAVVVGPGLGRDGWAKAVLEAALANARRVLVDADGLTLLATMSAPKGAERVLTPHPLEMARLLGKSDAAAVNADRYAAARECAVRYGAVALLKGAGTIVATPDGRCSVVPIAEPVLGVAGSGDVLSGAIGARLAERTDAVDAADAAVQAAMAHGRAGEMLRARHGASRGVLAGEIADALGVALEG